MHTDAQDACSAGVAVTRLQPGVCWDVTSQRPRRHLHSALRRRFIVVLILGSIVAVGISMLTGAPRPARSWLVGEAITNLAFGMHGEVYVTTRTDTAITEWDRRTGQRQRIFHGHTQAVTSLAVDTTHNRLLSGGRDGSVIVWDLATGTIHQHFHTDCHGVTSVVIGGDGTIAASCGNQGRIVVWASDQATIPRTLHVAALWVTSLALSPDTRWLAAHGHSDRTEVWEWRSGQRILTFPNASGGSTLTFIAAGTLLVTNRYDILEVWRIPDGQRIAQLPGHAALIQHVVTDPHGIVLATSSGSKGNMLENVPADLTVKVWDPNTFALLTSFYASDAAFDALALSPDAQWIAIGTHEGEVRVWKLATVCPRCRR